MEYSKTIPKKQLVKTILELEEVIINNQLLDIIDLPQAEVRCWEIHNCNHKSCPAYGTQYERCWLKVGAFCKLENNRKLTHEKHEDCRECPAFKKATESSDSRILEALRIISHQLNLLGISDQATRKISQKHYYQVTERFGLTPREGEVMLLLLEGHTRKQIARLLFIGAETVKVHIRNLYKKLDANSRDNLQDKLNDWQSVGV